MDLEANIELQKEELEVLESIYGTDYTIEDEFIPTFSILVHLGDTEGEEATLVVSFCPDYPTNAPPTFHLSIPWMRGPEKQRLSSALEQIYVENPGKPIVYNWVEKLRELLLESVPQTLDPVEPLLVLDSSESKSEDVSTVQEISDTPVDFVTGEPLTDRKSTFQAHVALVSHPNQVKLALNKLLQNKRISSATHNMYAYRIFDEKSNVWWQDCDDDGETHGGTRLLHLLQILNCRNLVVVVSRWYGGIMLYGDRFKHINNVARQLLQEEGLVPTSAKSGH